MEPESLTCEYCDKVFTQHRNLLTHVKTAKYCLKLRGIPLETSHVCSFCNAKFTQKSVLVSHLKSCKTVEEKEKGNLERKIREFSIKLRNLESQNNLLKAQIQERDVEIAERDLKLAEQDTKIKNQRAKINKQHVKITEQHVKITDQHVKIIDQEAKLAKRNTRISDQNKEIDILRKKADVNEGIIIGIDKAKPQVVKITNNTIVKQKLAAIPIGNIEPFTIDLVNKTIDQYDYNTFMLGALGIINYIKNITILEMNDGTVEKNYACTNRSLNTFHRLVEDKNWKQDGGARFIQEILSALADAASQHMDSLAKKIEDLPVRSNLKHYLLGRQIDLQPLETGLRNKNSKERQELFAQIKNQIKDTNNC